MVNVLFRHNGTLIDPSHADPFFRCLADEISKKAGQLRCPNSSHSGNATLVISYSDQQFHTHYENFCCTKYTALLSQRLGWLAPEQSETV